jgi:hypothetical protein
LGWLSRCQLLLLVVFLFSAVVLFLRLLAYIVNGSFHTCSTLLLGQERDPPLEVCVCKASFELPAAFVMLAMCLIHIFMACSTAVVMLPTAAHDLCSCALPGQACLRVVAEWSS